MSAKLTIRWETLTDLIADGLEDLAAAHWEEVEADCPLDLDWERAKDMERNGALKIATLRRNGELIGYAECMITSGLFFRSTRHAYIQAIYIEPRYRGFSALALIGWLEAEIGRDGRSKVYLAARTQRQCDLWEKMGYNLTETVFTKTVGGANAARAAAVYA